MSLVSATSAAMTMSTMSLSSSSTSNSNMLLSSLVSKLFYLFSCWILLSWFYTCHLRLLLILFLCLEN
jgi:hypothetical protein